MKYINRIVLVIPMAFALNQLQGQIPPVAPPTHLLNEVVNISGDFRDFSNIYYLADSLGSLDQETGKGSIVYNRYEYTTRQAFNNMLAVLSPVRANEIPEREYAASPELPFSIEFISPRTFRIRATSGLQSAPDEELLMLVAGFLPPWSGTIRKQEMLTGIQVHSVLSK